MSLYRVDVTRRVITRVHSRLGVKIAVLHLYLQVTNTRHWGRDRLWSPIPGRRTLGTSRSKYNKWFVRKRSHDIGSLVCLICHLVPHICSLWPLKNNSNVVLTYFGDRQHPVRSTRHSGGPRDRGSAEMWGEPDYVTSGFAFYMYVVLVFMFERFENDKCECGPHGIMISRLY